MSKVLFIGAHPDDIELGCGGTIYRYCEMGYQIRAIVIAEGSSSRYDNHHKYADIIKSDIKSRQENSVQSLENLGVNSYEFYNLPCSRLDSFSMLKINKIIESEIGHFNPDVVFTHSHVDTNKDHRIVFESTKVATRPAAFPKVNHVYCYEVLSSTECSYEQVFKPKYFIC